MHNPYQKKKDPKATKDLIIETAIRIGAADWSSLTFQHLADKTGISKGGIMHHFKSKDDLLDEIVKQSLVDLRFWVLNYKKENNLNESGLAYLHSVLETEKDERYLQIMRIILHAVMLKKQYLALWNQWYKENIVRELGRDRTKNLVAMLIADGIWYSETFGLNVVSDEDKKDILEYLKK